MDSEFIYELNSCMNSWENLWFSIKSIHQQLNTINLNKLWVSLLYKLWRCG